MLDPTLRTLEELITDGEPDGVVLSTLLGAPLEVPVVLRIAIAVAGALGRFHAKGLVHNDVKPANIVVDHATGRAWLTGTALTTRLARQRQAPASLEVISGTLSHMAPERTGRMNRSIDARSDLYSFGVTLYTMLAGALPLVAQTPIEWVHAHIARRPVPLDALGEGIPAPLSALVMRLLAKAAEERYQTAAGIEADLRHCLADWERLGRIDAFVLGTHDLDDRLLIPETLYGRETEIALLLSAFDRVVRDGTTELVLVSGYSGIGKSSVVNELHKALVPSRGLFAAGKFDQYRRGIPYATLAQAFQGLVRQILAQSGPEVALWKERLVEALGAHGQLVIHLIPEVERIIGPQPPVPDLPPPDTKTRFQRVWRRFVSVFARPEHPLALFLDDLQWLDIATLDLLEHLLGAADVGSLLLIGAYRDNEVPPEHPLVQALHRLRDARARMHQIVLAPLTSRDVETLVADALRGDAAATRPLAALIHEKTGGNPFFTVQFFAMLAELGLLVFSAERSSWTWDLERIRIQHSTDNVLLLVGSKLARLPAPTQELLRIFACLGNEAEVAKLAGVCEQSEPAVEDVLAPALETGLVLRLERSWRFLHDRVQEAAYALVPEAARAGLHLRIGRLLAAGPAAEERVFEIVNQMNRGASLIAAPEEREQLARLNLLAGTRAKSSTAYAAAAGYLGAGRALLANDDWVGHFELLFELEYQLADCAFLTGDPVVAEQRLVALSARAVTVADRSRVACLQITIATALDRSQSAIDVCFAFLHVVGIDWPPRPTAAEAREEYDAIWTELGDRPIEDLVDLPRMIDPIWRATIDVLTAVQPAALYIDPQLNCLIVCRMIRISLAHGNIDASCYAYVIFAMLLRPVFGEHDKAFRFGKLAFDLVETRGFQHFAARVLMCFGNIVSPWRHHARSTRPLVRRAFAAAQESGDLTFAVYSCHNLVTNMLVCGDALEETQRAAEGGFDFSRKANIRLAVDFITGQLRLIMSLRGLVPRFGHFDDDGFDEARFEAQLEANPSLSMATCWYWIRKLQARFFAGETSDALVAAEKAERLVWTSPSFLEGCELHFYAALAATVHHDGASDADRPALLASARRHGAEVTTGAASCAENFENRALLVDAEIARIEGRTSDAMRLYERAIHAARRHGFLHNEALIAELAARCYAASGLATAADAHLRDACAGYERWGARAKADDLRRRHPQLNDARSLASPTVETSIAQLDVAAVVNMSQAVSEEIILDRLVEKLTVMAVENAGAVRGLLVLPAGEALRIEAEATTGNDGVSVQLRRVVAVPAELPESVLRFVARSHEDVLLNDVLTPNEFSTDPYLQRRRTRSILCLPLVKQTRLMGVLYLENDLTPYVFTPPRIAVLKLLASQAAISLENARLYSEIQQAQRELAHVTRVTTMGQLAASIAHEVSQPVVGVLVNGNTALRWLARIPETSESHVEAREAVQRIVRDGGRARDVIARLRSLFKKTDAERVALDLNNAIEEVLVLTRTELEKRRVALRLDLAHELPSILGDRVALQQVMMNLILNATDAMSSVDDRPRELRIETKLVAPTEVLTTVVDSGIGLDAQALDKLFVAFHTTKSHGLGMGLSISRSIVESHQGRLWASANSGPGATFQFTLSTA